MRITVFFTTVYSCVRYTALYACMLVHVYTTYWSHDLLWLHPSPVFPPPTPPTDARGRCLLCVCQSDEGLSSPWTIQTEHGRPQPLFPSPWEVIGRALSKPLPSLQSCGKNTSKKCVCFNTNSVKSVCVHAVAFVPWSLLSFLFDTLRLWYSSTLKLDLVDVFVTKLMYIPH